MPETPLGIIYPDETSHTRLWEHFQALAETTESAIDTASPFRLLAGSVRINLSNSVQGNATVTFDPPFNTAPFVVATVTSYQFYASVPGGATSTGCTIGIRRELGPYTGTYTVNWIAVGV